MMHVGKFEGSPFRRRSSSVRPLSWPRYPRYLLFIIYLLILFIVSVITNHSFFNHFLESSPNRSPLRVAIIVSAVLIFFDVSFPIAELSGVASTLLRKTCCILGRLPKRYQTFRALCHYRNPSMRLGQMAIM